MTLWADGDSDHFAHHISGWVMEKVFDQFQRQRRRRRRVSVTLHASTALRKGRRGYLRTRPPQRTKLELRGIFWSWHTLEKMEGWREYMLVVGMRQDATVAQASSLVGVS